MTGWLALLAWALGASALHLRGRQRLVLAARAGHEVRGPLCAARLALDGLERSARVEAIDLELRRAALALDDLCERRARPPRRRAAAGGRRRPPAGRRRARLARARRAHGAGLEIDAALRAAWWGTGCASRRRAGTSSRTPSSTAAGACASARRRGAGRVRVEVADAGPGLPGADPGPRHRGARAALAARPRPGDRRGDRGAPRRPPARRCRPPAAPTSSWICPRRREPAAAGGAAARAGAGARCARRLGRRAPRGGAARPGRAGAWPCSSPRARWTRAGGSRRRTSRSGACPSGSRPPAGRWCRSW